MSILKEYMRFASSYAIFRLLLRKIRGIGSSERVGGTPDGDVGPDGGSSSSYSNATSRDTAGFCVFSRGSWNIATNKGSSVLLKSFSRSLPMRAKLEVETFDRMLRDSCTLVVAITFRNFFFFFFGDLV